jgi:hypothetical protein
MADSRSPKAMPPVALAVFSVEPATSNIITSRFPV